MLLDTIVSIASTYMHLRHIAPRSAALSSQSRALASLRTSIDCLANQEGNKSLAEITCLKREVLAAILLQITVEIHNGTGGVQSHIAYAASLFRELGYKDHRPTTPIGLILIHRMTIIDVLSSVFWRRRTLLSPEFWFIDQEEEYRMGNSTPRFQDTTGCPFWVVRILARISNLIVDIEYDEWGGQNVTRAFEVESGLTAGARQHMGGPAPTSTDDVTHVDIVGRCYYWSAVILLQRRVFLDTRDSLRVQMSLTALIGLLAALPIGCGPDSALSLPLYTAGLAAIKPDHRALIKEKSQKLDEYYPSQTRTALTAAFGCMWAAADAEVALAVNQSSCRQLELDSDLMRQRSLFIC